MISDSERQMKTLFITSITFTPIFRTLKGIPENYKARQSGGLAAGILFNSEGSSTMTI